MLLNSPDGLLCLIERFDDLSGIHQPLELQHLGQCGILNRLCDLSNGGFFVRPARFGNYPAPAITGRVIEQHRLFQLGQGVWGWPLALQIRMLPCESVRI